MADFSTPFSSVGGNFRLPTEDERDDGFPCGPADRSLFNGLFRRIEAELGAIVNEAAITPSDEDDTTVLQAILALIEAATGGGSADTYVLMSQARARLPIFPDVQHSDGHLNITSPSTGQVRVPAGRVFLHRGIYNVTTVQTDFATLSSKTYHLRWNPTDGFALKDLSDAGYNPSALAETNAAFDTDFDDMLVARVVTNSSNFATITNLINRTRLVSHTTWRGAISSELSSSWGTISGTSVSLNWARSPMVPPIISLSGFRSNETGPTGSQTGSSAGNIRALEIRLPSAGATRYAIPNLEYNYEDTTMNQGTADINITAMAV